MKPLGIDLKAPSKKNEFLGLGHADRRSEKEKRETDEAGNPIAGPRRKTRRRGGKRKQNAEEKEEPKTDMFDFLNDLGQARKGSSSVREEAQDKRGPTKNDALYKKMTPKELDERLKKKLVEKDEIVEKIKSLEESIRRNKER